MQHVPYSWYRFLHWVLTILSVSIAAAYPILLQVEPALAKPLGFSIATSALGVIHLLYALIGYRIALRSSQWGAGLLTMLPFTIIVIALITQTGGFASLYYAAWILLVAIVGMFGVYALIGYSFLVSIYFVMVTTGSLGLQNDIRQTLIAFAASYVVAFLSYFLWRRFYIRDTDARVMELGKELQAEQLKSEILINAITDGVVVFDTTGKIRLINPAGAQMIGWKIDEAVGLDFRSLFRFFRPQGKDEVELTENAHPFQVIFTNRQPVSEPAITLATRSEETRLIVSLSVSPILSSAEEITGAIAVFRDVSVEKRQERQRSEFISTASHEMRTPVAAIEGYLALALNDKVAKIDTKAREFLTKAHESTQHLGLLFRDLLAASKSEEGRLENHPQVIELGEFIERVVEESRFSVEKKNLRIEFLVAAQTTEAMTAVVRPLYYVYADPERIHEVMSNLISNAVKFTEEGTISVGLRAEPNYVQLSVRDTGIGIPKADIPHLFQKFYRVDNSRTRTIGGTGLGLFICRNIVELYKGQIWVESEMGKGTTFFINLPRISIEQAEEMKKREELQKSPLDGGVGA